MTRKQFLGAQFNYLLEHGTVDAGFWNRADVIAYTEAQTPKRINRTTHDALVNAPPSIGSLTYGND